MELIGIIDGRKIFYLNVRTEMDWYNSLPNKRWCAFTIANIRDKQLYIKAVPICLDKNVSLTCSAGQLSYKGEVLFDKKIVDMALTEERKTGQPFDYS